MAAPSISPQSGETTVRQGVAGADPNLAAAEGAFDQQLGLARGGQPAQGEQPGQTAAQADPGPPDEAAFQKQMFDRLTEGVDPDVQKRLSKWLPDVLDGGKKDLKKAAMNLSDQKADDLNALAKSMDVEARAEEVPNQDHAGSAFANAGEGTGHSAAYKRIAIMKDNREPLQAIKRAYGEQVLKASTPGLAPAVSYDSGSTLDASRNAVYEKFVSGLSEGKQERLADWLPDVLFGEKSGKKAAKKLSDKEEGALKALAEEHGIDIKAGGFLSGEGADRLRLDALETAFKRDLALDTTGELPSVVDMMLVDKFGKDNGDTAAHIDLKDDKILKEAKEIKKDFSELDAWLPAVLAGRGEMPEGDKGAKKLLVEFAEELGFDPKKGDDLGERAEKALKHLEKQDVIGKTLHPGKDDRDSAFLLFTDRFMESTLAYGAKNGALNQSQLLDAANVAEMLLGPDDGKDKPQDLEMVGLQAAVLHRTDKRLVRPQEVMAASGYINAAETLAEQKTRLTEVVLAFHVREEIGTPPMTPLQWAKNYADLHPEMLDDLGNRAFNAPTGEKLQIITQHLGVPGDHKFMIDKKRKIKMEVDQAGNLDHFDVDKKKKSFFKKFLDVAVPVIGTVLTFVPGAQAVGIGINAAYGAYSGAQAIKDGDLLGGLVGIAGALPGLGVGGKMVSLGSKFAGGALQTFRAIENKDWMGALAGGLSTFAAGSGHQGFQTAATGVSTAGALKEGDFLQAGAGFAGMAGDLSRPGYNPNQSADLQDPHNSTSLAFNTLSSGLDVADGIQEKNYAQIGGGLSSGIGGFGEELDYERRYAEEMSLPPETGVGGGPGAGDTTGIQQAGYQNPAIEVAGGDTLSQIAARHGTTVEALMAANPGIDDPNRVHAGQQLTLPNGVQPVGTEQQVRLAEFADSQGGPSHLPSPPRPGQGDPMLQPGATHPNADSGATPAIDIERANLHRSDLRLEQLALEGKRDDLLQELDHVQQTRPQDRNSSSRNEFQVQNDLAAVEQRLDANQTRIESPEPLTTVEVRVKPILGGNAGHAFAIVTDPYGNEFQTRGGAELDDVWPKDGTIFGDIVTEPVEYDEDAKDYNDTQQVWPSITIGNFSGDQADLINKAMKEAAAEVKAERHQYYPSHQNSNSAIREILERTEQKTGLDLNIPADPPGLIAPGWNTDLPNR